MPVFQGNFLYKVKMYAFKIKLLALKHKHLSMYSCLSVEDLSAVILSDHLRLVEREDEIPIFLGDSPCEGKALEFLKKIKLLMLMRDSLSELECLGEESLAVFLRLNPFDLVVKASSYYAIDAESKEFFENEFDELAGYFVFKEQGFSAAWRGRLVLILDDRARSSSFCKDKFKLPLPLEQWDVCSVTGGPIIRLAGLRTPIKFPGAEAGLSFSYQGRSQKVRSCQGLEETSYCDFADDSDPIPGNILDDEERSQEIKDHGQRRLGASLRATGGIPSCSIAQCEAPPPISDEERSQDVRSHAQGQLRASCSAADSKPSCSVVQCKASRFTFLGRGKENCRFVSRMRASNG
jgi:hypothetical protein